MSSRQFGITGRLVSTCQWLLEHESYLAWCDDSQLAKHLGFLWLKGKPGAGKSTLMRFAYEEHKRPESRRQRAPKTVIAGFFFHARGEELQRSVTGMYRSLVYQLFKGFPHLGELLDDSELLPLSKKECPSLDQLRELFQRGISCLGNRQFVCYVDALDECDEKDIAHMARFFQDLAEEHNQRDPRFRVFFSSRHYPFVPSRIGLQLELDNQPGHADDLKRYTERRLLYKDEVITKVLIEKSRGVFMWIVLVIDILNEDNAGGLPLSAASKKLQELPEDLSALFGEILRRHGSHMDEFIIAVVWILFATRPLTPKELEHAIWSDQADDEAADMLCSDMSTAEEADRLRKRVTRACKGLAEIITHGDSSAVQFIHESVRDFLLKDQGLVQVWPEVGPHITHHGHEKLKRCCANYINSAKIRKAFSKTTVDYMDLPGILKNYSFLEYAVKNVFHHAEQAEPVIQQMQFLRSLDIEPLTRSLGIFDKRGEAHLRSGTDMLYLLADGGHARLINSWGEDLPMSCTLRGKYGSALIVALAGKQTEAISALLKLPTAMCTKAQLMNGPGDRSKLRPGWNHSLLSWAAEGAHTGLIRVLLDKGARINELDPGGYTALARAVLKLSEYKPSTKTVTFLERESYMRDPAVSMLLRNGAEWDVQTAISVSKEGILPRSGPGTKVDDRFRFRWTLFEWSVCERNLQDLLFMCDSGNHGKNTYLLHHAARSGRMEAVKLLTDSCNGINLRPELRDPWSYNTPRKEALSNNHSDVVALLLAKGDNVCDEGIFHYTLFSSYIAQDRLSQLKSLAEKGSTADWHLSFGVAPLVLAIRWGSKTITEWLLANGAGIECRDEKGRTPLMMASMEARPAMVKMLLQHGADCQAKTPDGWSSLMFACRYSVLGSEMASYEIVRYLVQDGADVNARGKSGDTALKLAVEWGDQRLVRLLLLAGADITAKDDQSLTTLFGELHAQAQAHAVWPIL
jgi:ankyrin repeat protein